REQEVGYVHTPDQQNQRYRAEKQSQRLADITYDIFLQWHQPNFPGILRRVIGGILFLQGCDESVDAALRYCQTQTWLKARDRLRNVSLISRRMVLHRRTVKARRSPHFRVPLRCSSARSVKSRRHYRHNAIQVGVQAYAFVKNVWIASEQASPQAVANDHFSGKSGTITVGIENAAHLRLHSKQRKIIRRDDAQADGHGR